MNARQLHNPHPILSGESLVLDGEILARGIPIGEVIGRTSYIDMLFFQLLARSPSDRDRTMLDAYLVSLCEHGVTSPSTHGARVAASVRGPFAASAISFIAGAMGPLHFGALEQTMRELLEIERTGESSTAFVDRHTARRQRVWGFGHRFHKSSGDPGTNHNLQEDADPRVRRLIELAETLEWDGTHLARVRELGHILFERKRIPINIDGIGAGILLDLGFSPESALLFVIVGRLPNIARLYQDEQAERPNRFTALATGTDPGFDRTVDRDQGDPSRLGASQ